MLQLNNQRSRLPSEPKLTDNHNSPAILGGGINSP